MNEFLNENLKPYNALTREEKHILFDAHLDGNVECHYDKPEWYPLYKSDGFNDLTVYRTKPKEPERIFPATSLTGSELSSTFNTAEGWNTLDDGLIAVANAAIRRYILEQENILEQGGVK